MSEIKALEKLRNWKCEGHPCAAMRTCADEIQAEVDERERLLKQNTSVTEDYYKDMIAEMYMPLPLDRDGVPIRVGDMIEYEGDEDTYRLHAQGVYVYGNGLVGVMNERFGIWYPENCRHVKPRTLEDVLEEFYHDASDADAFCTVKIDDVLDKYAAEIRELLGVDA